MSIIKFSMALIGLVACIFNSLPAATAASYDKYFVVSQDTFLPFPVKAVDSTDVEYLNLTGDATSSSVYLSNPNSPTSNRRIGTFILPDGIFGLGWVPYFISNNEPPESSPVVYLTEVVSIEDGNEILAVDTPAICSICPPPPTYYTAMRGQPYRKTLANGEQIEAVYVQIEAVPFGQVKSIFWAAYYFGYGVGLIAEDTQDTQIQVQSFNLISLPPPKAEGTVVEYVNTLDFPNAPGGHFFYTADPAEQSGVDAGGAGHFVRTGRSFASGGFLPVCRFYGSMSPGPNSHFFTIAENECEGLKALQVTPTPATIQQWNYEGLGFYSVAPIPHGEGQIECMAGTEPVYRAYNNAYPTSGGKNPWDSNHRYSTQSADIDEMVVKGWRSEGVVLCAPVVVQ